jgi:hypothetical protein
MLSDIEHSPVFQQMLAQGVVRRIRVRGFIPWHKRVEYEAKQVMAFVHRNQLDRKPEWEELVQGPIGWRRVVELARLWEVPETELRRVVRFLHQPDQAGKRERRTTLQFEMASLPDGDRVAVSQAEVFERASGFVKRYGLSEQDFLDYVMGGEYSAEELTEHFGCPVAEAQALLAAVLSLEISDLAASPVPTHGGAGGKLAECRGGVLAAETAVDSSGSLQVRFPEDPATTRYVIDRRSAATFLGSSEHRGEAEAILARLRILNERSSHLALIILAVCRYQTAFIASGDYLDLRPLSQAEVARHVGCDRSTVCRLIREHFVRTPFGTVSLAELMPGTQDVVHSAIRAHPNCSDSEIARGLAARLGIAVSRRLVNYHRRAWSRRINAGEEPMGCCRGR